ncbi:MAG TPA: NAD-dependent epimerase/dehydratase family protein [Arenibaculum sp.]|nr:NAD-dependent epimerase/dehydratase family protein [Arenibaculum sp.]
MNFGEKRDVVFGAGPVGLGVAERLRQMNREVVLATRSGKAGASSGVTAVKADLTKPDEVRHLATGADTVYLCASPPYHRWADEFGPMMEGFVRGVEGTQARIVLADNLYAYGPTTAPMTETTPEQPTSVKGRVRRDAARRLMELNEAGNLRVAIGRAADFYGPRVVTSALGLRVFQSIARGKAAPCLGNVDLPHSYTFIDDFARGLVILGTRDEALGKIWHIPSGPASTTREMVTLIAEAYAKPVRLMVAPRWLITVAAPFNSTMRELKEVLYQFEQPFIMDSSRFASAFGDHSTKPGDAIMKTIAWVRSGSSSATPVPALEH